MLQFGLVDKHKHELHTNEHKSVVWERQVFNKIMFGKVYIWWFDGTGEHCAYIDAVKVYHND
jgi:hypothetical protein